MARIAKALLLVSGFALAGPALADDLPPKLGGFVLGARLGLAIPGGRAARGTENIGYAVPVAVPFQLDLAGRLSFGLGFGGYFQLAPGGTDHCPADATCSALSMRLGLQAEYRFLQGRRVMPWVGAGVGLEWLFLRLEAGGQESRSYYSGPEGVLQGGVDFRLGRRWAIGPYLALHVAEYSRRRFETPLGTQDETIPSGERATHTWTVLGVRSSVTF